MNCPLCHSKNTGKILATPAWSIRNCRTCTNAWTVPSPKPVEYAERDFHGNNEAPDIHGESLSVPDLPDDWKQSIAKQVQMLVRHLKPESKILEIGCGEGLLLSQLREAGFQVQGVEPSLTGSERARRKGLDVVTGYFPNDAVKGSFDAVVISHVLEHLPDPLEILRDICKAAPQGYLLLVQTNYQGIMPRIDRDRWYAWVPQEHFWHFTPKGLTQIASSVGFRPVENEYSTLCHFGKRRRLLVKVMSLFPQTLDQFHLLLKHVSA